MTSYQKPPDLTASSRVRQQMDYSSAKDNNNHNDDDDDDKALELDIDDAIELLGQGPFQLRVLLAAGFCFAADSMEILLLSFLAVVLQVEWSLSDTETASIVSSVFVGAMAGTVVLGRAGDVYGRKPIFLITAGMISVMGLLTAVTHEYWSLLIARAMVGFGVGGLTVPFDTLAEFVPTSHRGTNLLAIEYFWVAGSLLVPFLAYLSLGRHAQGDDREWRVFVVLCAVPCFISTALGILFVPESPRWLLTQGRQRDALRILRRAAVQNDKDPNEVFPPGTLLVDPNQHEDASFADLWTPQWRHNTVMLAITWMGLGIVYYGAIMAITLAFSDSTTEETGALDKNGQYSFDYAAIFTSSSSELVGLSMAIFLIDRTGRVRTQASFYLAGGLFVCILCWLDQDARIPKVMAAFLARLSFMAATCITWVSTAEILTTELRTTGHSFANAMGRIGGALSPYLVRKETPFPVVGIILFLASTLAAIASSQLPETKGKSMGSTAPSQGEGTELAVNTANGSATSYGIV